MSLFELKSLKRRSRGKKKVCESKSSAHASSDSLQIAKQIDYF